VSRSNSDSVYGFDNYYYLEHESRTKRQLKRMAVKRDERGRWRKGTPPPNPAGRPKDGQSWSAIISEIGDMYPEDILAFIPKNNDLGRTIAQLPKSVQMKYLVIMRVYAALMFEPTSGLLKEFLDRMEGKVSEHIDMTSGGEKLSNLSDEDKIARILALVQKAKNNES
jgi:hypothetical protein